jgi:hypothetical protein
LRNLTSRLLLRLPWIWIAVAFSLEFAACAVPFGPAYVVENQHIDVNYPASSPGFASIRASYRLKNVGSTSIASFEVRLPDPRFLVTRGLQIQWNGETIQPSAARDSETKFHLPLSSGWKPHVQNELTIAYDVRTGSRSADANSSTNSPVFLPSGGWYPEIEPPGGFLASGGVPPKKWKVNVSVPQDYVAYTSGRDRRHSRRNGKSEIRSDYSSPGYLPFLVAGPFVHEDIRVKFGIVSFWSAAPVPATRAHEVAERVASSIEFLQTEFGPRKNFPHEVRIIECPASSPALTSRPWIARDGCVGLPGAAIVPEGFLSAAQSRSDTPDAEKVILESIDAQLAATWLYFTARVDANAPMFPIAAAADYASFSFGVSRDPASRFAVVGHLLTLLPAESIPDRSKSLSAVTRDMDPGVRDLAFVKSELFFIALEDRCGAPQLHRALARIVRVLGGDTWGANELRSAAEAECGSDLGKFFRDWLSQTEIPADFRSKYGSAGTNAIQ